jgi:acetoin utilization deacetylase AcuC-like enzyme
MQVVHSDAHRQHHPAHFLVRGVQAASPEVPERAERLAAAARADGHAFRAPESHGLGPIAAVHAPDYLNHLATIVARWPHPPGGQVEVIPNVHPQVRSGATYPTGPVGQAGWHQADTACPIGPGTWPAARASADIAVSAASLVHAGAPVAYALCRPPGHHAYADMAGGFCFLNNCAIAAQWLRTHGHPRVAILDVDVHHGNGTQEIFYARPDVLTVSLHADPANFYPFFWGHAHERGIGDGSGFNLNLPIAHGTTDAGVLSGLDAALDRVRLFAPTVLVVALGLDAHAGDPLHALALSTEGFAEMARRIAGLGLPAVLVQEGGYLQDALGANLASFLRGYEGAVAG